MSGYPFLQVCLTFISSRLKEVMETDTFKQLSDNSPTLQKEVLSATASFIERQRETGDFDGTDARGRRVRQRIA